MWRLANHVRRYAWGSTTEIPRLLGREPDGQPQAELWLGAHPSAPSRIDGSPVPLGLDAAIAADPVGALGAGVAENFGARLPFLLKFLAVEQPLSLQAHPSKERARAGFAAEEAAGVPIDAPHRNYRDPNHKPELVMALDEFEALCGFRDPAASAAALAGLTSPLARALRADLAAADPSEALRSAMTRLLTLPPGDRAALVTETTEELASGTASPCPHLRAVLDLADRYPGDPGALAALLLNHVVLAPGEALFLPAGNVHAYLNGVAVEVMATSDNVLRAGLTTKHVDPEELLQVIDYTVLPVPYVEPVVRDGLVEYRPQVEDFALVVAEPGEKAVWLPEGPAIALVLDGSVELHAPAEDTLPLAQGESAFLSAGTGPVLASGRGRVIVATVADPSASPVRGGPHANTPWSAVHPNLDPVNPR
ncbi:mannose-6-phosphate isomerase, class I [Thermobifida cellulosilytica]|uniref:mannose-6-phosphate isomerase n=1 Tax=Thermobifida cellulosilytica TB100 TaxID=665004 RepID=A0A147KLI8_THECS|nr:mannose-6-phosphate isomerase, class I [Thermobifida cellulosilytica]KUP98184.1 mannose-6-phosphate isomerase [Thermobifida cellulosilytica TB100]